MAAGLGFKTFATGDVLSAADTNGYLMQGVLVFASAAARDSSITSPQEGQFAYLKDTNVTTYYTGSAWANLDTTGMTNPMTTTGDTIYSSSGSTPARLGIGSTGQVLTVAGGVPSWATPATTASGLTKVASASFSAVANTSTTFDGVFTSAYKNYQVIFIGKGSTGLDLRVNWREAGVTYSGGTYAYGSYRIPYTGATTVAQNGSNTYFVPLDLENVNTQHIVNMYVHGVGVASNPVYTWTAAGYGNGLRGSLNGGGITNAGLTVTGFILTASTGTLTGECFVYGLAN